MANINSLMSTSSSSASSIYGNRNILSGLASGLDTESMIENSIIGYKTKIQKLIGQQTKLTWKQDAVRSISDKMIALADKYTSYTSKTNLASPSFFKNAVTTTTGGKFKDLASATGRSSSDVQLNAVKQLASAARYTVGTDHLNVGNAVGDALDLTGQMDVGKLSGRMEITVGGRRVSLDFSDTDVYKNAQDMVNGINEKLKANGDDKLVSAKLSGGKITFEAGESAQRGDSVWISSASSSLEKSLGVKAGKLGEGDKSISFPSDTSKLYETQNKASYLSGKTINVTLDGVTKTIKLGNLSGTTGDELNRSLVNNLNSSLRSAFGEGKVTASLTDDGKLSFTTNQDSTVKVVGDSDQMNSALGLGKSGVSNYMDTSKTLGELLGDDMGGLTADANGKYSLTINGVKVGSFTKDSTMEQVLSEINSSDAGVKAAYSKLTGKFTFEAAATGAGGKIDMGDDLAAKLFGSVTLRTAKNEDGDSTGLLADAEGKAIKITTNGESYYLKMRSDGKYYQAKIDGSFLRDSNRNYKEVDTTTEEFQNALLDARDGFTRGKDAIFNVRVNGEDITLTRSSNIVDLDGLSVTLKGVFNESSIGDTKVNGRYTFDKNQVEADTPITFTTKANADDLVKTIQEFVDSYNEIIKQVRTEYTTQPLNKNKSASSSSSSLYKGYEPLTDEDKANMSESEIKAYEEKAKTGLLFGDSDLRRTYDALRNAITAFDLDRKSMEAIGLTTAYENGLTTLTLDEDKLRAALDKDPDMVQKVFTQSKETGAAADGLMARVKNVMNTYASTSIGNYGALVQKAGNKASSQSLLKNTLQQQIDSLDTQIDRWQTKMSNKIDYYTKQFTALEKMMEQFNSQSSALAGLMGGY